MQSLNVMNFNRMREELEKMFEVDEIQAEVGKMRGFGEGFQRDVEIRQI
jgi:hypothetical protein